MAVALHGRLVIETSDEHGNPVGRWEDDNVICYNGLTALASAIAYLGVEDIASDIGLPSTVMFPVYGAIGTGDVTTSPPNSSDTQLVNEINRVSASSGGSSPASNSIPAQIVWQFQFPINVTGTAITLTEAGIFSLAQSTVNSGQMLDHAAFSPQPVWNVNQYLTLSLQLSLGVS